MEKQPVHDLDWDYLVVLDACRYDYFEENYDDYLKGELEKVESKGSATPEWLRETFTGRRYNYTYITANPYVNKEGNTLGDLVNAWNIDWYAADKFTEIHQAWVDEWYEEIGTVKPEDMREYSLEKIDRNDGKTIIHFIQPHRPFISYDGESRHSWGQRNAAAETNKDWRGRIKNLLRPVWATAFYSLPKKYQYEIRGVLGKTDQYRRFAEEEGGERVKKFYEKDLRMALEEISKLVEELDGKVVVTADHGESFGEEYEWGHPIGSRNPVLVEVPWLEVKK